jgi:alkanesulfonate monooxygenase SsuD/methylene tetrahydromethanopterin reductase-like flavin-dependent oxidoreductase (luciferase family)
MDFNHFLSTHLLDTSSGGKTAYSNMIEQAVLADNLGYRAVSIPEHHLINILCIPSPLQMAVKLSNLTANVELVTSVVVLPIRDMRLLAGEIVQADILSDNRLIVGVGRGAFAYEVGRLGIALEKTQHKFNESLSVLQALLNREEVSWNGDYYKFDPITIMPRPMRAIPLMMAATSLEGIYHSTRKGFSIQTTPLGASNDWLLQQVAAFHRGKAEAEEDRAGLRLSLQRGIYLARDEADANEKINFAYEFFKRFDNVYSGPGIVKNGMIVPLPRSQTKEELAQNLLICPRNEMIDRLSSYQETGIDEIIMSTNYGQPQEHTLEMMQRFGEEIIPHFL